MISDGKMVILESCFVSFFRCHFVHLGRLKSNGKIIISVSYISQPVLHVIACKRYHMYVSDGKMITDGYNNC